MTDSRALDRLTPERRRAMTREHLLAAAAEVFARRGYHAASLDEVAEAAGFTKGAVYSNFSSKEDLFQALASQRQKELIESFAAAASPDLAAGDLISSLRAVYAGTSTDERERNWQLFNEFTLHSMRDPRARERLVSDQRTAFQLIVELVKRQCDEAGVEPPVSVELIARMYIALFTGLWGQQAVDPEGVDDDAFAAAIVFVGDAIAALGQPRRTRRRRPRSGREQV